MCLLSWGDRQHFGQFLNWTVCFLIVESWKAFVFWAHVLYQTRDLSTFSPSSWLIFALFRASFKTQRFFIVMRPNSSISSLMGLAFGVIAKKFCLHQCHQGFLLLSCGSLVILGPTFGSSSVLCSFVCEVWCTDCVSFLSFIFLHVDVQGLQHHLLKRQLNIFWCYGFFFN